MSANDEYLEVLDPNSGRFYYVHIQTKATQWNKPDGFVSSADTDANAEPPVTTPRLSVQERPAQSTASALQRDSVMASSSPFQQQQQQQQYQYQQQHVQQTTSIAEGDEEESTDTSSDESDDDDTGAAAAAVEEPVDVDDDATAGEWRQVQDPNTGRPYYYNSATKETSWTKPMELRLRDGSDEGVDNSQWREVLDPNTQRCYYYNSVTKETTWVDPRVNSGDGSAAAGGGGGGVASTIAEEPEVDDESSGDSGEHDGGGGGGADAAVIQTSFDPNAVSGADQAGVVCDDSDAEDEFDDADADAPHQHPGMIVPTTTVVTANGRSVPVNAAGEEDGEDASTYKKMRRMQPRKSYFVQDKARMAALVAQEKVQQQECIMSGFLKKKSPSGMMRKMWQGRWWKLYSDVLKYFRKETDDESAGVIPLAALKSCTILTGKKEGCRFDIVVDDGTPSGRVFSMLADTAQSCTMWVDAINVVVKKLQKSGAGGAASLAMVSAAGGKFWKDTRAMEDKRAQAMQLGTATASGRGKGSGGKGKGGGGANDAGDDQLLMSITGLHTGAAAVGLGQVYHAANRREPDASHWVHALPLNQPGASLMQDLHKLMAQLEHPYLMRTVHLGTTSDSCFAMYRPGFGQQHSLRSLVQTHGHIPESTVRFWASELVCALGYLHNEGLSFLSMSADNVYVDGAGHACIADVLLGLPGDKMPTSTTATAYYCPDAIGNVCSDWWRFGMLLYELLTGSCAQVGADGRVALTYPEGVLLSRQCKELLAALLTPDVHARLGSGSEGDGRGGNGFDAVLDHAFFTDVTWAVVEQRKRSHNPTPWIIRHFVERLSDTQRLQLRARTEEDMTTDISVRVTIHAAQNLAPRVEAANALKKSGKISKKARKAAAAAEAAALAAGSGDSLAPYCLVTVESTSVRTTTAQGADCSWETATKEGGGILKKSGAGGVGANEFAFALRDYQGGLHTDCSVEVASQIANTSIGDPIGSVNVPLSQLQSIGTMRGWYSIISDYGTVQGELHMTLRWIERSTLKQEPQYHTVPLTLAYLTGFNGIDYNAIVRLPPRDKKSACVKEFVIVFDEDNRPRVIEDNEDDGNDNGYEPSQSMSCTSGPGGGGSGGGGVMGKLRSAVSKKKKRFQQDGFDLDLTYINSRIMAMGLPADGLSSAARNPRSEVVRMLDKYHPGHYKVYNLCSEQNYDGSCFTQTGGQYAHIGFSDHNPPSFSQLIDFCLDVHEYLSAHPSNVVAVHCKAGKGRTGVMIAAYLLYCGATRSSDAALTFFARQRTTNAEGVTIPSQERFVHYFGEYVQQYLGAGDDSSKSKDKSNSDSVSVPRLRFPFHGRPLVLRHVRFTHVPNFDSGGGCDPYFICKGPQPFSHTMYDHKEAMNGRVQGFHDKNAMMYADIATVGSPVLYGDVKFLFYDADLTTDKKMFWFWLNTAFVKNKHFALKKIQCDGARKDNKQQHFSHEFMCELFFE